MPSPISRASSGSERARRMPKRYGGFRRGIAAIPDDDLGARLVQMTCIGAAHVAEADESDLVSFERHRYGRVCIRHEVSRESKSRRLKHA